MNIEIIKTCKACNEMFPNTADFYPTIKGGYLSRKCRICSYAASKAWRAVQPDCTLEGCTNRRQSRGLCITHYKQAFFAGDLERLRTLPYRAIVGYSGLHQRIRLAKGNASNHECIHCNRTAEDWALDHTNLTDWHVEIVNGSPLKYSHNADDYIPLCTKCHKAFDTKKVAA